MTKKTKLLNKQIRKAYKKTGGKTVEGMDITFRQFKNRVLAKMKMEGISASKAARRTLNTESFTTAAQRSRTNLVDSIRREFRAQYGELSRLNKTLRNERGQFTSLKSNLVWSKEYNGYVLGDRYLVDVSNSPKEIIITDLGDLW